MKPAIRKPRVARQVADKRAVATGGGGMGMAGLKVRRILVPVDFSETAEITLPYALAFAKNMEARIVLMHVIEAVYPATETGLASLPVLDLPEEAKACRKRMQKLGQEFVPQHLLDRIVICRGLPHLEIVKSAKRLKAGLIVIATHGRTGLSRLLMGSTAEHVVRQAPCPVLTVRRTQ